MAAELREANEHSVRFISGLRDEFGSDDVPTVLAAVTGPQGDAYAANTKLSSDEAFAYHRTQNSDRLVGRHRHRHAHGDDRYP
ncbi:MAG: hypothetical protein HRU17_05260 [Polyangiaceae bacterium]|nr:hypothetical protein [Polyangiaceae bacterium]